MPPNSTRRHAAVHRLFNVQNLSGNCQAHQKPPLAIGTSSSARPQQSVARRESRGVAESHCPSSGTEIHSKAANRSSDRSNRGLHAPSAVAPGNAAFDLHASSAKRGMRRRKRLRQLQRLRQSPAMAGKRAERARRRYSTEGKGTRCSVPGGAPAETASMKRTASRRRAILPSALHPPAAARGVRNRSCHARAQPPDDFEAGTVVAAASVAAARPLAGLRPRPSAPPGFRVE